MSAETIILVVLGVLGFLSGAVGQFFSPYSTTIAPIDIPFLIGCNLLVFSWYRTDSGRLGYRRSIVLNLSVMAFGAITVPYYLFQSRGGRRGFLSLGWLLLAILAYIALQIFGQFATYSLLQSA